MDSRLKIVIAASEDTPDKPGLFQVKYGGEFAFRKFLPHITDYKDKEGLCPEKCKAFRGKYNLDYSGDIVGIISFPSVLPELMDDAHLYIKKDLPEHDVLIAIGIHPDILIELIKKAVTMGCKALIIPREDPCWMTTSFVNKIKNLCEGEGLECAFPRPFCSLTRGKSQIINKFIDQFKIGRPDYQLFYDEEGRIEDIDVKCSSPCGATYYVASGLLGCTREEIVDVANHLWHSYPCLSSSKMDPELKDSPMHMAAYINLYAARDAIKNL